MFNSRSSFSVAWAAKLKDCQRDSSLALLHAFPSYLNLIAFEPPVEVIEKLMAVVQSARQSEEALSS